MDITARRRRDHVKITANQIEYCHDLNMFTKPLYEEITLNEFEQLAVQRVDLLRILENATFKGHTTFSDEWRECVKVDLLKQNLKKFVRLISGMSSQSELDVQARRADHYSHFILTMAYCRSEQLRRWFINREMEWFKLKFMVQTPEAIQRFLKDANIDYVPISESEREKLKTQLIESTIGLNEVALSTTNFYKVPFVEVLSLVKSRRVFLADGFAYVPSNELGAVVQTTFRKILSQSLNQTFVKMQKLKDDRLEPILQHLHLMHTGNEYTGNNDKSEINLADIDALAKKSFPLCMRQMHETLRADHHLKHSARLIYGLFLKSIGLLYENFIAFWRMEFTKNMDEDKFNREYLYNFNHQYGKVGKMTNYSPYSCAKIINGAVAPGEPHGCPFRHSSIEYLKLKLLDSGVSEIDSSDVVELAKGHHYQLACTKYFELIHSQSPSMAINHPTQYFDDSRKVLEDAAAGGTQSDLLDKSTKK